MDTPACSTPEELTERQIIEWYFADIPILIDIGLAESELKAHAKNPHSSAFSYWQILAGTWEAYGCKGVRGELRAEMTCARKIYEQDGTTPWNESKHIWGK